MKKQIEQCMNAFKNYQSIHPFRPILITMLVMIILFGGGIIGTKINASSVYKKDIITFSDAAFEKEMQILFEKEEICQADLDSVTNLIIQDNYEVKNISDIAKCRNLKSIVITNCKVEDISPLAEMEYLERADLSRNNISDISELERSISLHTLILDNNKIKDFSALCKLYDLEYLSLAGNNISNIPDEIHELQALGYLNLENNRLITIDKLSGMDNLNELKAGSNKLYMAPRLAELPKLEKLSLRNNALTYIDTLGGLPALEELDVSSNHLSDLVFLKSYSNLKKLILANNEFETLEGVLECEQLEYLDIRGTEIQDVTLLQRLDNFNSIFVDDSFDRSQLEFMVGCFRETDTLTKQYLLKIQHKL